MSSAQTNLSNAEVFDFEVGDVFHHTYSAEINLQSYPGSSFLDTVITEAWTTDLDSVMYVFSSWRHALPFMGFPSTITHVFDSLWVTDLSYPATHYGLSSPCPPVLDSLGPDQDHCNRTAWVQYQTGDTCPGNYDSWISTFLQGCGGPYYTSYEYWTFTYQEHLLRYYRNGSDECGTALSIPLGLPAENVAPNTMQLSPNPATDRVTIILSRPIQEAHVEVFNVQGELVQSIPLNSTSTDIRITHLNAGIYFARVRGNAEVLVTAFSVWDH